MLNNHISYGSRLILLRVLLLSGANGLVMEIVFRRQLVLSFGVMHYSVATVLSVFMAGLAFGSFLFGRIADRIKYPPKLYGVLEIGVGLAGLLLISIFSYLDPLVEWSIQDSAAMPFDRKRNQASRQIYEL